MRIDPLNTPAPPPKPTAGTVTNTNSRPTDSSAAVNNPGSFTPTSELAALLAAVRKSPDVRPEAVQSATEHLASGELDTSEAAADSARSLITDLPAPPSQ